MTQTDIAPDPVQKKSKLPLLLGLLGALVFGGGGFYATFSGLVLGHSDPSDPAVESLPSMTFVAVDPIMISLGPNASARHLRFASQLEIEGAHADDVRLLLPRIVDVLNSYLRAVEVSQLEDPSALVRLKAQMLRRIQIVTGEGRVRNLLISEFVLN
jgi:flagellar FliL protein